MSFLNNLWGADSAAKESPKTEPIDFSIPVEQEDQESAEKEIVPNNPLMNVKTREVLRGKRTVNYAVLEIPGKDGFTAQEAAQEAAVAEDFVLGFDDVLGGGLPKQHQQSYSSSYGMQQQNHYNRNPNYHVTDFAHYPRKVRALVCFMPLGVSKEGVALFSDALVEVEKERRDAYRDGLEDWKIIAVDRPGVGNTSFESARDQDEDEDDSSTPVRRIKVHTDDVLKVLETEKVDYVHVYGACLGHPFAAAFALRLMVEGQFSDKVVLGTRDNMQSQDGSDAGAGGDSHPQARLQYPLYLNVPWASTKSPYTMGVARLGGSMPTFLMDGVGAAFGCLNSAVYACARSFLSAERTGRTMLHQNASKEEIERSAYTPDDFIRLGHVLQKSMEQGSQKATRKEMTVAVSPDWHSEVCEALAIQAKILFDSNNGSSPKSTTTASDGNSSPRQQDMPNEKPRKEWVRLFASDTDQVVNIEAVRWIAAHYDAHDFVTVLKDSCHETMITGGGPIRNAPIHKAVVDDIFASHH